MSELRLHNVNKIFPGAVQAVKDFTIDIQPGEFIVLVGPSGCGKTTILRMIAGLESITSGDIYLDGKRINNIAPADRDISMVFQDYALYGHMSVYQNIGFSQIIRHEDQDVIHDKVMDAAEIVELKDQLNRYPKNLSGGQRQRVALGRAIVNKAGVILMDEPLSNLDAKLRVQARQELKKLHHRLGNMFVYVTHDQTEAMTMADRIVVMDGGCIQQIGTPDEVYHQPENVFVGGFIGSPAMNFIQGRIEDCHFIAPGIKLRIPQAMVNGLGSYLARQHFDNQIVLGFRPEHFSEGQDEYSDRITGELEASEFLGNRSLVYFRAADQRIVASLQQNGTKSPGDLLEVFLNMHQVHFFDPKTGSRIRQEGGIQ
ncbi:MAG: sn-glycerol-3-phosphate ABC transporter ATP-binding protein UgpC [Chloroflexota bacterium]|nr:MAG: sn-glycerol-3-phosphate ABC transporter ATP-binding protein UgpC [Chloroflexota bacterium]